MNLSAPLLYDDEHPDVTAGKLVSEREMNLDLGLFHRVSQNN